MTRTYVRNSTFQHRERGIPQHVATSSIENVLQDLIADHPTVLWRFHGDRTLRISIHVLVRYQQLLARNTLTGFKIKTLS